MNAQPAALVGGALLETRLELLDERRREELGDGGLRRGKGRQRGRRRGRVLGGVERLERLEVAVSRLLQRGDRQLRERALKAVCTLRSTRQRTASRMLRWRLGRGSGGDSDMADSHIGPTDESSTGLEPAALAEGDMCRDLVEAAGTRFAKAERSIKRGRKVQDRATDQKPSYEPGSATLATAGSPRERSRAAGRGPHVDSLTDLIISLSTSSGEKKDTHSLRSGFAGCESASTTMSKLPGRAGCGRTRASLGRTTSTYQVGRIHGIKQEWRRVG